MRICQILKYSFARICIFISVMLILTSCSAAVPEEKAVRAKLNFRITWDSFSGRGEAVQAIIDRYHQNENRKAEITLIGGNENRDETSEQLIIKDNKTIFVLPYRYILHYGNEGMLTDLNPEMAEFQNLFYESIWNLNIVDDQLFGLPWVGHSICLLYNKQLLESAGIDPISLIDMESFKMALALIEEKTTAKGVGLVGAVHNDVSWMVNQFIYGFGGSLVDGDTGEVRINQPATVDAIAFYRDSLGPYAQANWQNETGVDVMNHFLKQEIAFEFQGVWGLTDVLKNGEPFEVGVIPLSQLGLKAEVGPLMISVPSTMSEEDREAALDFMTFLISTEAQALIMKGEYSPEHDTYYPFRVPLRIDLFDTLVKNNFEEYVPFIEGLKNPSIDVPIPEWEQVKSRYYEEGLHQVMTGNLSIEKFLANLTQNAEQVIKESRYGDGD